jgi:predicted membrane channel-forming protein YqfA (hemolysin III family)
VTRRSPWHPRNRREVLALLCLVLLVWLMVVLTVAGLAPWPAAGLAAFGIGGAALILAAGGFWAWRFRR